LYIKALIEPGAIDWPQLIAMMSLNGARLCTLAGKGDLSPGSDADVTLIDPKMNWTIDVNDFKSKSRNCPFDGWRVQGKAIATIVDGDIKHLLDQDRLKTR
jgi:dihydroorotase